jgi:predicted Zn-dependent protease
LTSTGSSAPSQPFEREVPLIPRDLIRRIASRLDSATTRHGRCLALSEISMLRRVSLLLLCSGIALAAGCAPTPDAQYLKSVEQARALIDDNRAYIDNSRLDEALTITTRLIEAHPGIALGYVQAARARAQGGHLPLDKTAAGAEQLVRSAIELDTGNCEAHTVLAGLLYRAKRYEEGLKELDAADRTACDYAWRHVQRGRILNEQQHYDEAAKAFAQVPPAAADQHNARDAYTQAQHGLAWIAYRHDDAQALHDFTLAGLKQADEDDPWARGNASDLLTRAGYFDEAIALAREALKRKNYQAGREDLANALYGQSLWLSSRAGDTDTAARAAAMQAEAASIDPDFKRAGGVLWGSLANHDSAFRGLLQQRLQNSQADNL